MQPRRAAYRKSAAVIDLIDRRGTVKIDCGRARTSAEVATDILSVGVIAIELLDGMPVTPTVEDIIALALRRDRSQRWQSAAAMLDGWMQTYGIAVERVLKLPAGSIRVTEGGFALAFLEA